ncbi:MAG: hypothetical protein JW760_10215 [Spirochaetales bacterium]|nr:hypothetical protein [Spirochaetales bacterium]
MKKISPLMVCLLLLLLGSGCTTPFFFPPGADGFWYAPGYGAIVEIGHRSDLRYFEVTEVSFLEQDLPFTGLPGFYFRVVDEDHAVLGVEGTSWNYRLERINGLPDRQIYRTATRDYRVNFEVLWHTFNERYAFFQERGVDWDAVYQDYAPRAALCTSDDEFYTLVVEVLDLFDDNHILFYRSEKDPGWYDTDAFRADWIRHEDVTKTFESLVKLQSPFSCRTAGEVFQEDLWHPFLTVIKNNYLSGDYISCCQDMIFYGTLDDTTGYIAVLKEDYYTGRRGDVPLQGLAVLNRGLDKMTAYFTGVPNIIIDARFNWGGTDSYSLAMASRFTDRRDMAAYQTAREGTSQVNYQDFFYAPDTGPGFDAENVYVLVGPASLSSGECLAMYLGNLEKVTVVGEHTMGVWSNTLIRHLPNGWEFTLSNERIYDPKGTNYEVVGYPPDVVVGFNPRGFDLGKDAVLDSTLELIAGRASH